jgi:hypothetical protein
MKALATVAESVEKIRDDEMGASKSERELQGKEGQRQGWDLIEYSTAPYHRSFNNHFLPHRHNHNVPAPLFQSQAQDCPEFMLSSFRAFKSPSSY